MKGGCVWGGGDELFKVIGRVYVKVYVNVIY